MNSVRCNNEDPECVLMKVAIDWWYLYDVYIELFMNEMMQWSQDYIQLWLKTKSEFRLCLGIPIIGDYSFVSLFAIFSLLSEDVGG